MCARAEMRKVNERSSCTEPENKNKKSSKGDVGEYFCKLTGSFFATS